MTTFALRCLGAIEVLVGATPHSNFATDKTRALLAYLALEANRSHTRAKLVGLFWPEIAQESAQNNLRVTLHRLRVAMNNVQPRYGRGVTP